MAALGKSLRHPHAHRTQRFEVVTGHRSGMAVAQPRQHFNLGGGNDRPHRPQRVVQIETQDQRTTALIGSCLRIGGHRVLAELISSYSRAKRRAISRKSQVWDYNRGTRIHQRETAMAADRSLYTCMFLALSAAARAAGAAAPGRRRRPPAAFQRSGSGAPRAHLGDFRFAGRQAGGLYPAQHRYGGQQGPHQHLAARYGASEDCRRLAASPTSPPTRMPRSGAPMGDLFTFCPIAAVPPRCGALQTRWAGRRPARLRTRRAPTRSRLPICRSTSAVFASLPRAIGFW